MCRVARDAERFRLTFNQDALLYDRMRPAYPAQLIDDLVVMSGLRRGGRPVRGPRGPTARGSIP
jgi:hypothetical protein